jgi:MFS family permease
VTIFLFSYRRNPLSIVAFGLAKAITNYFTGKLANRFGRKKLLVAGWILAVPVPFILIYAPNWNWVIFANLLLGIHQGLAWSSTVVMKIDLVGEKKRGFAMGLNEFFGYLAVGIVAFATGWIADHFGVTPYPFYLGLGLAVIGLLLSVLFIKDTSAHAQMEGTISKTKELENVFIQMSFSNKTLSSVTQAGLVNNMNDGTIWGLLPMLLFANNLPTKHIALVAAVYPLVWGHWSIVHRWNVRSLVEEEDDFRRHATAGTRNYSYPFHPSSRLAHSRSINRRIWNCAGLSYLSFNHCADY